MVYSGLMVHWRNYNMVAAQPIFSTWLGDKAEVVNRYLHKELSVNAMQHMAVLYLRELLVAPHFHTRKGSV